MSNFIERFDGLASSYDRYRPRYPEKLFGHLVELAPENADLAVDVAAGTGISAAVLLKVAPRHWRVIAVEPGRDMRKVLSERFGDEPRVEVLEARAEALPLGDGKAGLVTACAAVHWFDQQSFLFEARRILMPLGVLAVVNYDWARQPVVEAFDAYLFKDNPEQVGAIQRRNLEQWQLLRKAPGFGRLREYSARWTLRSTAEEIAGIWLTRSWAKPLLERLGEERIKDDLRKIYREHQGDAPMDLHCDMVARTVTRTS